MTARKTIATTALWQALIGNGVFIAVLAVLSSTTAAQANTAADTSPLGNSLNCSAKNSVLRSNRCVDLNSLDFLGKEIDETNHGRADCIHYGCGNCRFIGPGI